MLLTEVRRVVSLGARQLQFVQEWHDASRGPLVRAPSLRHHVHMVELGEQARRGCMEGAYHCATSSSHSLEKGYAG